MLTDEQPNPYFQPAPPPPRRRGRGQAVSLVVAGALVGALATGAAAFGVTALTDGSTTAARSGSTSQVQDGTYGGTTRQDGVTGPGTGPGAGAAPGDPGGRFFSGDDTSTATTEDATDEQEVGVVDVYTTLSSGSQAAGTGMVLTSGGKILTNHHVIEGATAIKVVVVSTQQEYTAELVGSNSDADIAVLQLEDASGLDTVDLDTSGDLAIGDDVTGVGNAGGDGGSSSAAAGTVTALDQSITTQSEGSTEGEALTGLIEVDADIQSGDSGGPLYDADGEVVGIDTAASVGTGSTTGYAVPIGAALRVVDQVDAGDTSDGTTIGYPAFLGVELSDATTTTVDGATIAGVVDGGAAADAGLVAGDTVTGVGGRDVTDAASLSSAIATHQPGDRVRVAWRDADGAEQSSTVTLTEGPAA
ncbi:MAG: trypsin-like peptidase domain-containing protein [Nocardioidaceae bacterium]|nr:trypsin-like peptidase domain-containing protein [Nocardioidaceae bacterium]